jgi:vacuolar iron transporter family protein
MPPHIAMRDEKMPLGKSDWRNLKNYVFGSAAAIITNVSLIVGLGSARTGKGPILGGLLTIALADNISDSLGFHLYREAGSSGERLTFASTVLNFTSRLLVSLSFVAVVLAFSVARAIPIAIVWGLFLLVLVSYLITRSNRKSSLLEIGKHVLVAVVVIFLSYQVGHLIAQHF